MKHTISAFLLVSSLAFSSVTHADVVTPKAGSAERKAIMDALRPVVKKRTTEEPTFYDVEVKTEDGWAFVQADPKNADGTKNLLSGNVVIALLKRDGARWRVVQSDYTDASDSDDKKVAILKNHSNAPALIFGGYAARWGYGTFPSIPYSGVSLTPTEKHHILTLDQTFLTTAAKEFSRSKKFTNAELISFGAWLASGKKQEPNNLKVSAQEVDAALAEVLPQKITKHGASDLPWNPTTRTYSLTAGDGIEGELTALSSVRKNSDGTYRAVIATVDFQTGKATGWRHMIFKRVPGNPNAFPTLEWQSGK